MVGSARGKPCRGALRYLKLFSPWFRGLFVIVRVDCLLWAPARPIPKPLLPAFFLLRRRSPASGRESVTRRDHARRKPRNSQFPAQKDVSGRASPSGAEVTMAAALARLGLRAVKEVRVQFCPFEQNVESTRTFLQAVSSEKVRSTNLNCSVVVDVRHDGSEPCVDVLFGDGHRLIMRGAHLTAQEMLTAFASHIQARGAAGVGGDKPGAESGR
nr:39S ribosomal protein L53, mitochondrial [Oryctolagus cuniculus]